MSFTTKTEPRARTRTSKPATPGGMAPGATPLLLVLLAGACLLGGAAASGVFELNISQLVDSFGRDLRDDCCSWQRQAALNDTLAGAPVAFQCEPNKCQLIVRVCVKNFQSQQVDTSQCTFGELTAQVQRPHEPPAPYAALFMRPPSVARPPANIHHQRMFQQQRMWARQPGAQLAASGQPRALRSVSFHQPMAFPFNFTWPGAFSLAVDAWFEAPTELARAGFPLPAAGAGTPSRPTSYDLYRRQLIIRHSMRAWLGAKDEWTNELHKTDSATLSYSYRVSCQQHYYGDQCNILCRPREDPFGHYTCSSLGSIVCRPGWAGAYCSEPQCAAGCAHGNCSRPGECTCRPGWTGDQCAQCLTFPGCVHGSCERPHECVCDEGWGGLLCNEDLNFCSTHQPCQNGGVCQNTFDAAGVGSFNCTCAGDFSGRHCELSAAQQAAATRPAGAADAQPRAAPAKDAPRAELHQPPAAARGRDSQPAARPPPHQAPAAASQDGSAPARAQTLDHWLLAAYVIIVVCMVILVVLLALRFALERSTAGPHGAIYASHAHHSADDEASMQNHQNIYKSRTSIATDKVPLDLQAGCSSGDCSAASSLSRAYHRGRQHGRQPYHTSYHNLRSLQQHLASQQQQPPPPYATISHLGAHNHALGHHHSQHQLHHAHAASATSLYGIYNFGSVYGHLGTLAPAAAPTRAPAYAATSAAAAASNYGYSGSSQSSSGAATQTGAAASSQTQAAADTPTQQQPQPQNSSSANGATSGVYGSAGQAAAYQQPCYVIAYPIQP